MGDMFLLMQVESDHMNNASILYSCDGIERVMWIVCVWVCKQHVGLWKKGGH